MRQYGLRDWIIKYNDGKADPVLVERWINLPYSRGMIHFFRPELVKHSGVSTFMCQGNETGSVFSCEPIAETALDLGIVTWLDLAHSTDRRLQVVNTGTGYWAGASAVKAYWLTLQYLLHARFGSTHDGVEQAMANDSSVEAGTDGFAVPDAVGQFCIKLSNVVTGIRGDPFRNPAVVGWYRELGQ